MSAPVGRSPRHSTLTHHPPQPPPHAGPSGCGRPRRASQDCGGAAIPSVSPQNRGQKGPGWESVPGAGWSPRRRWGRGRGERAGGEWIGTELRVAAPRVGWNKEGAAGMVRVGWGCGVQPRSLRGSPGTDAPAQAGQCSPPPSPPTSVWAGAAGVKLSVTRLCP